MKQLSKRIVAICSCIMLIIMHIFVLGGSGSRDEKLVKAEEITKSLLISNDENYDGVCSGYYIKGLDEKEDFILVTSNNGGYAIFTTEFQLVEYSRYNKSPYGDIAKSNSYYAGPANYFEKEDDEIISVRTGEKITKEEKINLSTAVKDTLRDIHQQDKIETEKIKKIELEQKRTEEENRVKTIDEHVEINEQELASLGEEIAMSSIGTGDLGPVEETFTQGLVASTNLIEDYNYFLQSPYLGINDNGNSIAVAVQLLLSFNNWSKDSRLITEPKFLARYDSEGVLKPESLNQPYGKDYISTTYKSDYGVNNILSTTNQYLNWYSTFTQDQINNFDEVLANSKSFFEYLYYSIECLYGLVQGNEVCDGIWKYIQDYTDLIYGVDFILGYSEYQSISQALPSEEIENNRPALSVIRTRYYVETILQDIQWVVIYGEQQLRINGIYTDGYIAHFGFNDLEYVWFNKELVEHTVIMELTHEHNYQPLETNSHIIECKIENGGCGSRKTTNQHSPNYLGNCELIYNVKTGEETNFHFAFCSCGYAHKVSHNYQYRTAGLNNHYKYCSSCGLSARLEAHTFKYGNCYYCGQLDFA